MIENELLIIKEFIPALIEKQSELSTNRVKIAQPILLNMFYGLMEIEDRRQIYIKENAPHFNIFSIMRYGHYETRLHTPFLVHLLTPNGHHQLEFQFFNLFINYIYDRKDNPFIESEIKNIQVFEEYTDGTLIKTINETQVKILDGQIDIFIHFLYKNENFHVVIENKINASDGEKQLQRYYSFLEYKMQKPENIRLIYLTKHGSKPSIPFSINLITYNKLKKEGILKLLSYKENVADWVEILINGNTPQSVKEILRQYLNTIK